MIPMAIEELYFSKTPESVPDISNWPAERFSKASTPAMAMRLAEDVAPFGLNPTTGKVEGELIARTLGFDVSYSDQRSLAEARMGTSRRRNFFIAVDPKLRQGYIDLPAEFPEFSLKQVKQALTNFRFLHEIGHTFFYDWQPGITGSRPPKLIDRGKHELNEPEEFWCDILAFHLAIIGADTSDYRLAKKYFGKSSVFRKK